jgi:hypothetical protein
MFTELVPGIAMRLLHSFRVRNDKKLVASVELAMGLPRRVFYTARNDTGNDKKRATSLLRNDKVRGQVCKQVLILTGLVFNGYLLANHLHFAILLQTFPCQDFYISYLSVAIPE